MLFSFRRFSSGKESRYVVQKAVLGSTCPVRIVFKSIRYPLGRQDSSGPSTGTETSSSDLESIGLISTVRVIHLFNTFVCLFSISR